MSNTFTWLYMVSCLTRCLTSANVCSSSPKQVVYMDRECGRVLYDDGLSEHDCYEVKSDKKIEGGLSKWNDRQHVDKCDIGFDFGDRMIALVVESWLCEKIDTEAYLNIYADCTTQRNRLLKQFNSSHQYPLAPVYSPSSCVSLFFYRGSQNQTGGCHFVIKIVARYELFPAFKISAIIVSSIVLLMLVVKITCLITGYERHLPNLTLNLEEHKFILTESSPGDHDVVQVQHPTEIDNMGHGMSPNDKGHSSSGLTAPSQNRGHSLLSVTRSAGSESHCSASADLASEVDFFDLPTTPKLKRYPSAKASSIWTHK